jgi:hypothetical protein
MSTTPSIINTTANNFVGVACGRHHTLTYTKTGQVYAWGDNSRQQLGSTASSSPILVTGKSVDNRIVVGVAAGHRHSIALYVSLIYTNLIVHLMDL